MTAIENVLISKHGFYTTVLSNRRATVDILGLLRAQRMKLSQAFVHPSVFARDVGVPHPIELFLPQRHEPAMHPVADLRGDIERLSAAGQNMRVEQSGDDLVNV